MASDITNGAQFATSNMKPAPGEQADALWAQKVADNTGYLWYRHWPGPTADVDYISDASGYGGFDGTWRGTKFFRKEVQHGTLYGSYVCIFGGANNQGMELFVNNVSILARNTAGSGYMTGSFEATIGALTDGNTYEFTHHLKAPNTTTADRFSLSLTSWFKP